MTRRRNVGYPVQRDSRRVLHRLALPSQYISSRCLSQVPASRYYMLCDWQPGKRILCNWRLNKDVRINVAGVVSRCKQPVRECFQLVSLIDRPERLLGRTLIRKLHVGQGSFTNRGTFAEGTETTVRELIFGLQRQCICCALVTAYDKGKVYMALSQSVVRRGGGGGSSLPMGGADDCMQMLEGFCSRVSVLHEHVGYQVAFLLDFFQ